MQSWISSAVILIALFAGFIALVAWAWSKQQKLRFDKASQLPLEDDHAVIKEIRKVENQSDEGQGGQEQPGIRMSSDLGSKEQDPYSNNDSNKDNKG